MSLLTVRDASFYPAFTNIATTVSSIGSNASLFVPPALISTLFLSVPLQFIEVGIWYTVFALQMISS